MGEFLIYPAIDLYRGSVVRLRQGNPQDKTMFRESAPAYARHWLELGARWLHVVNLSAALDEEEEDFYGSIASIVRIAETYQAKVQFGGGLRTPSRIEAVFDMGVARVILGTLAVEEPQVVQKVVARYTAERVVAAVDIRSGILMTHGWKRDGSLSVQEFVQGLKALGIQNLLYTDIQRDGMGTGLNLTMAVNLMAVGGVKVFVAGGVASLEDIRSAKGIGASGVVLGRALYEGKVDLPQALSLEVPQRC